MQKALEKKLRHFCFFCGALRSESELHYQSLQVILFYAPLLLAVLKDVFGGSMFQECIRNIYLLKVELCFIIPGH